MLIESEWKQSALRRRTLKADLPQFGRACVPRSAFRGSRQMLRVTRGVAHPWGRSAPASSIPLRDCVAHILVFLGIMPLTSSTPARNLLKIPLISTFELGTGAVVTRPVVHAAIEIAAVSLIRVAIPFTA